MKKLFSKVVEKPIEGKWFEVKPKEINQKLFKKKKRDESQEQTRRLILYAFEEMDKYPEKYGKNFKTLIPKKDWESKTTEELEELACELGDHNADIVEQALEWAQRIANGESWKSICNKYDTCSFPRIITFGNIKVRVGGGPKKVIDYDVSVPATNLGHYAEKCDKFVGVPLVISYK